MIVSDGPEAQSEPKDRFERAIVRHREQLAQQGEVFLGGNNQCENPADNIHFRGRSSN